MLCIADDTPMPTSSWIVIQNGARAVNLETIQSIEFTGAKPQLKFNFAPPSPSVSCFVEETAAIVHELVNYGIHLNIPK
jgi:hypothetical protein